MPKQTLVGRKETKGWKIVRESMSGASLRSMNRSQASLHMRKSNQGIRQHGSRVSLNQRSSKVSVGGGKPGIRRSNCFVIPEASSSSDANRLSVTVGWVAQN